MAQKFDLLSFISNIKNTILIPIQVEFYKISTFHINFKYVWNEVYERRKFSRKNGPIS